MNSPFCRFAFRFGVIAFRFAAALRLTGTGNATGGEIDLIYASSASLYIYTCAVMPVVAPLQNDVNASAHAVDQKLGCTFVHAFRVDIIPFTYDIS